MSRDRRHRWQDLERDLAAAARLGRGEALEAALETLATQPALRRLIGEPDALESHLRPLAGALLRALPESDRLPTLKRLATDPRPLLRALAACALGGQPAEAALAIRLASDRRPEVRACLLRSLEAWPLEARRGLAAEWLAADSPRLRGFALRLLPAEVTQDTLAALRRALEEEHPAVVEAVEEALARLAAADPEGLLEALEVWAEEAGPQGRRHLARALSRRPLHRQPERVLALVRALALRWGEADPRPLVGALRALARSRGADWVRRRLEAWRAGGEAPLRGLAERALPRLR